MRRSSKASVKLDHLQMQQRQRHREETPSLLSAIPIGTKVVDTLLQRHPPIQPLVG